MKYFFTILFLLLTASASFADSPITSTNFSDAYTDIEIIEEAKKFNVMETKYAEFLNGNNPIDQKLALINALSWKMSGKKNANIYTYITYGKPYYQLDPNELSPEKNLLIGYLVVMDDYFHPENSIPYLEAAADGMKNSFSARVIYSLAMAQVYMDTDWCKVWSVVNDVYKVPTMNQDMRESAKGIIMEYISLYEEYCK